MSLARNVSTEATVSFRGGVALGWLRASWPLGSLAVSKERLTLSAMLDRVELQPQEVVAIETPPILGGIRIRHNRADCPETLRFMTVGGRDRVLAAIARSGFVPSGQPAQRRGGFPLRWSVVAVALVLWNLVALMEFFKADGGPPLPGIWMILNCFLLFGFSALTLKSDRLQAFVMRDGHHFGEVRAVFKLLRLISGGLAVGFLVGQLLK